MEAVNAYLSNTDDGSTLSVKSMKGIIRHLPSIELKPSDSRLVDELVRVLNADDDDLRPKEVSLQALSILSEKPQHLDLIQAGLASLAVGFERFFERTSGLESDTVSRNLHVFVLTLFYRLSGFNLSGADLVELTSTLPSALYALQSVFFEPSLPHDIHIAAANTLMQLTLPDTYFTSGECTDLTDLERLTKTYNKQVNTLMKTCMDLEMFNVLSGLLRPWLRHCTNLAKGASAAAFLTPLHAVMGGVLQFVVNLLNYSTSHGRKFRHHLSADSDFIEEVVLPYLVLSTNTVHSATQAGQLVSGRDLDSIRLALRVLVVSTFKMKTLRRYFRENNFSKQMLGMNSLMADDRVLALIIKLNINIDFTIPPSNTPRRMSHVERVRRSVESKDDSGTRELPSESNLEKSAAELVAAIRRRVRSLSDDGRARLRKRLSAVDPSSPMQRACHSYDVLSFAVDALQYEIEAASGDAAAAEAALLGLSAGAGAAAGAGGDDDDDDDDDEPVAVLETPRLGRSALSMLSKWQEQRDHPAVAAASIAEGKGGDDDDSDDGGEAAGASNGRPSGAGAGAGAGSEAPSSKEAESKSSAADATADAEQESKLSRRTSSGRFGARAPHHLPPMAGGGGGGGLGGGKRLGALPKAGLPSTAPAPVVAPAVEAVPVPSRHLCALTKSVMEDPVTTPEGVNYERSAIEEYLNTHDLCPETGEPLSQADLKPNKELGKEIALFQFRRLMLGSKLNRKPLA